MTPSSAGAPIGAPVDFYGHAVGQVTLHLVALAHDLPRLAVQGFQLLGVAAGIDQSRDP